MNGRQRSVLWSPSICIPVIFLWSVLNIMSHILVNFKSLFSVFRGGNSWENSATWTKWWKGTVDICTSHCVDRSKRMHIHIMSIGAVKYGHKCDIPGWVLVYQPRFFFFFFFFKISQAFSSNGQGVHSVGFKGGGGEVLVGKKATNQLN